MLVTHQGSLCLETSPSFEFGVGEGCSEDNRSEFSCSIEWLLFLRGLFSCL